jgi:hypothetical protein
MCFSIIAWATLFHGRPQAGVVALSEHCLAICRRSVHAAMLSAYVCANGAIATGIISCPHATFRKVVTGIWKRMLDSNQRSSGYEPNGMTSSLIRN